MITENKQTTEQFALPWVQFSGGVKAGEIHFTVGECALGAVLVAVSERGLCRVALGDGADTLVPELSGRFPKATVLNGDDALGRLVAQIAMLIDTPGLAPELPLDVQGTDFQRRVWRALRDIPSGITRSYTDIAKCIGAPKAARAVASACAANPLAVVIPCHRVIRSDGGLSGYRWGIERKRALLAREAK